MGLGEELSRRGLSLGPGVLDKLRTYLSELERWNRRINLTSLAGEELARRLVVEPCWLGKQLQMSGRLADLGSGNGSPGIPLYFSCGLERVELVEARIRRAAFLRHIAAQLHGEGIVVHRVRLEDLVAPLQDITWITLQAVAPSRRLVEAMRRLFRPTTRVVWITSADVPLLAHATCTYVPESNTVAQVLQLDQF